MISRMDKHLSLLFSIILSSTMGAAQDPLVAPDQKADRRSFSALNIANSNNYLGTFSQISDPRPTKQGPVLFPNDAPPPPRPPLIVTARPLFEQIARSELNPLPRTRNQTEDNINLLKLLTGQTPSPGDYSLQSSRPHRLYSSALGSSNNPYEDIDLSDHYSKTRNVTKGSTDFLNLLSSPSPATSVNALESSRINLKHSYAELLKSYPDVETNQEKGYKIYEPQPSPLPPLYKKLPQQAHQNAIKTVVEKQESTNEYQQTADYDGNSLSGDEVAKIDYGDSSDQSANYAFSYAVKDRDTGDDFSHSQHSSGQATRGEYRVRLPDGRLQVVSYTADEGGYQAQVRYDDEPTEQNKEELKNDDTAFKINYDVNPGGQSKDYSRFGGDYSTEYNDLIIKPKPSFHTSILSEVNKSPAKLGRIIVPSKDYDYSVETYNKNSFSTTSKYNDIDTILITPTKPSFNKNSYIVASTPSGIDYKDLYSVTPKPSAYNSYLSGYLGSKYSYASPKPTPVYEQYTVSPDYYKNTLSPSAQNNYLVTKDYLNNYQKPTHQTPIAGYSSYEDYSGDNLGKNNGYSRINHGLKDTGKSIDYGAKFNKYLDYN